MKNRAQASRPDYGSDAESEHQSETPRPSLIDEIKGMWLTAGPARLSDGEPQRLSRCLSSHSVSVITAVLGALLITALLATMVHPGFIVRVEFIPTRLASEADLVPQASADDSSAVSVDSLAGGDVEVLGDACGMAEAEAAAVLAQPHGWLKSEKRESYSLVLVQYSTV